MTDSKNPPSKPTLTLKPRTETGVVRQSFSHGRTKAVVVEKVRRRANPADAKASEQPAATAPAATPRTTAKAASPAPAPAPEKPSAASSAAKSGVVLRTLTEEERAARVAALADSKVREAEERKIAEEEARRRAERDARERTERDAAEARKRDEEDRRKHDDEAKRRAEQEASKRFGGTPETTPSSSPASVRPAGSPASRAAAAAAEPDDDEAPRARRGIGGAPARPAPPPKPTRGAPQKQRGRLTVVTALNADEVRERSVASFRRRTQRMTGHRDNEQKEKLVREVTIPETITIQELANRMAERGVDVIKLLMKQGQMLKITDSIDADTAQLIAEEMGHTVKRVAESDVEGRHV